MEPACGQAGRSHPFPVSSTGGEYRRTKSESQYLFSPRSFSPFPLLTHPLPSRLSLWACSFRKFPLPRSSTFRDQDGVSMRNTFRLLLTISLGLAVCIGSAQAQFKNGSQATELNLPRISQHGVTTQTIGISTVTIEYSRPLAGTREVWGKTVPYGKVWRSGANENTTITFSDDVTIEGKPLPAGTYGLHMIPDKDQWTIIFSKNSTSWGSFSYDEKEDALRVTVKPAVAENRDTLAYTFDDMKMDSTSITLRWGKVAVPFHVKVDTMAIVLRSIQNQLRNTGGFTWAGYDEAANWLLDTNSNLDQAMKWEDQSILIEERFENLLGKSMILDAMGRKDDAAKAYSAALQKASAIQLYVYARGLQRSGNAKRAFELYPQVPQKDANHWVSHLALARISWNSGDFPRAA